MWRYLHRNDFRLLGSFSGAGSMKLKIMAALLICLTSGCREKATIELGTCWNKLSLESGTKIRSRALALYNADGPLGINDICGRNSMKADFKDNAIELQVIKIMRDGIGGKLYGSAVYEVKVVGTVSPSADKVNLYDIQIDRLDFVNGVPLDGPR